MQLKLADEIRSSNTRNLSNRRPHEIINEIDSETPDETRNADYSTSLYCSTSCRSVNILAMDCFSFHDSFFIKNLSTEYAAPPESPADFSSLREVRSLFVFQE